MPVTTDVSPFTSVTASPMESHDSHELPIELKIPLPSSSACSDEEEEEMGNEVVGVGQGPSKEYVAGEKDIPLDTSDPISNEHKNAPMDTTGLEESQETSTITLEKVTHLVELEAYQKRRTLSAQTGMEQLSLSCGLDRRLISTYSIAYGNMIDQYKTFDQSGFAGLYEACEQLKTSRDVASRSIGSLPLDFEEDSRALIDLENRPSIQMLPLEERENILTFLAQIRTEPSFLSERISNLSPSELTALTSSYHPAGIDLSILQNHSHGKSQFFSRDSQMMKLSRRMDNLHRFHDQDPFFALLYGVFDSSAQPGSQEHLRRIDVWSTACAKNMVEGFGGSRPGSDELAIALLDAFAGFQDWTLKPKMEIWVMKVLVDGSFLLESTPSQPVNHKEPMETHNAKAAIAEADFFENALTDFFELLTSGDIQQAVPAEALAFAHAVLQKIEDPKLRLRARQFIVIRWYFATFISSIVVYPEVRGIMMTQHIGDTARRLILQKLVVRLQERVFDVVLPWNQHAWVKPEIRDRIMAIFHSFEQPELSDPAILSVGPNQDEDKSTRFLMLSPLDIVGLVQAIYPERQGPSNLVDPTSMITVSNRPSTAGSSTLVTGSSDVGSALTTPSAPDTIGDLFSKEESIVGRLDKEKDPYTTPEGALKKVVPIPNKIAQQDFGSKLRTASQKMKDLMARDGTLNSIALSNTWSYIYYSKDGLTLSMASNLPSADLQEPLTPSRHKDLELDYKTNDYEALKSAVVMLLSGGHRSGVRSPMVSNVSDIIQFKNDRDPLEMLIEAAMKKAQSSLDFRNAHLWWSHLKVYRLYLLSHPSTSFHTLLQDVSKDLEGRMDLAAKITKDCEIQCRSLSRLQLDYRSVLAKMVEQRYSLRVKMWYISDVRHSATYEEALYVTRALRTIASLKRPKQPGSISNWARQRLRGSNIHDRAEAQTLEAMVSPKDHGGLSKLADEQVELTSRWLTRKSIENFCKGEERIHRFCYEIQRSVSKIAGTSLLESPVLWSSNLFKRERVSFDADRSKAGVLGSPFGAPFAPPGQHEYGPIHSPALSFSNNPSIDHSTSKARSPTGGYGGFWSTNQPSRQPTGLGFNGNRPILPPTPTSPPMSWSSNPFGPGSPMNMAAPPTPFSSSFGGHSRGNSEGEALPAKKAFVEQIKKNLRSLLISDLGYLLWNHGSETDVWVNDHVADEQEGTNQTTASAPSKSSEYVTDRHDIISENVSHQDWAPGTEPYTSSHLLKGTSHPSQTETHKDRRDSFPFSEAYKTLLQEMSLSPDPYAKLYLLYELEDLVLKSMDSWEFSGPMSSDSTRSRPRHTKFSLRSKSVPRTKATSLEEVIANCTERRAGTLRSIVSGNDSNMLPFRSGSTEAAIPGTDDIVNALLSIFRDPKLRPTFLFRDLQYIAAFVPSETLDQTPQGKAFWDAGLAALALKEDLCESMINRANQITAYHISPRNSLDAVADKALALTTLRDAANLWLVTAKEGSPVAARELGLFYLTHPELLSRITMPFSKANDVFRAVISNDIRSGDKDKGALDPYTFAVAFHWMEIAANGGDKDARDFLKGNGELSGGR